MTEIYQWSHPVLDFCLLGIFWLLSFISSNCSVSIFIYSWFNLRRFMFLGIYSLLLGCPICWYITVCSNLFVVLWCLITSSLSFLVYLGPFFFLKKILFLSFILYRSLISVWSTTLTIHIPFPGRFFTLCVFLLLISDTSFKLK